MLPLATAMSVLGTVVLWGCASLRGRGSSAHATHQVRIADFRFSPANLTVLAGDRVQWRNEDRFIHTVFFEGGRLASGELQYGTPFVLDVSEPGTYPYYCSAHPSMRGTLTVAARR